MSPLELSGAVRRSGEAQRATVAWAAVCAAADQFLSLWGRGGTSPDGDGHADRVLALRVVGRQDLSSELTALRIALRGGEQGDGVKGAELEKAVVDAVDFIERVSGRRPTASELT